MQCTYHDPTLCSINPLSSMPRPILGGHKIPLQYIQNVVKFYIWSEKIGFFIVTFRHKNWVEMTIKSKGFWVLSPLKKGICHSQLLQTFLGRNKSTQTLFRMFIFSSTCLKYYTKKSLKWLCKLVHTKTKKLFGAYFSGFFSRTLRVSKLIWVTI